MAPDERLSGATNTVHGHLSRVMHALQRSPTVSYILDSQFRITYCNPAWNYFAELNGAPELTSSAAVGCRLFDIIPEVLRKAYADAFQRVLATGRVWEHAYECSSPALFREYRMRIHLLKPQNWYVITNPLSFERRHAGGSSADAQTYVNADGFVIMCAHCRCSKRLSKPEQWDFVPEYLQPSSVSGAKVSHGLCPICKAYFYQLG